MIQSTLYTRHLRPIALLGSSTRRIGINLRRRPIRRIRHPGTQAQTLLARDGYDALLRYRFADDFSIGIRRSDVRHLPHGLDHGCEPFRSGTRLVLYEVEPVGNFALRAIVHDPIPGELRGSEFRFVGIGRLVQVEVAGPILDVAHVLPQEPDQRRGLVRRRLGVERPTLDDFAVRIEGSIRICSLLRPSLNSFIAPGTDAWGYEDVEVLQVARRLPAGQE
mmetsp:Transcript_24044/g.58062  ORF Transcript_24044/g.58062 Transcript_24044/m.58062 type:complete len:221 (+) Transcript_24044:102-764(+)